MATYGLTQQQRKNYFTKSTTRVPENVIDYVELFVFDLDDVLLERKKFTFSELVSDNYVEYSGVLKLNIGQHLRDLGYSVDDFRVEYKFFKRVAGNIKRKRIQSRPTIWNKRSKWRIKIFCNRFRG